MVLSRYIKKYFLFSLLAFSLHGLATAVKNKELVKTVLFETQAIAALQGDLLEEDNNEVTTKQQFAVFEFSISAVLIRDFIQTRGIVQTPITIFLPRFILWRVLRL